MLKKLRSATLVFKIQLERLIDHTWRDLTGLPTLKRSELTPQLYLGGQHNSRALRKLKNIGITAIVNMREVNEVPEILFEKVGINILHLPTQDRHAPTLEQLSKGAHFIKEEIAKGGKVYVHCKSGEGRGPTMAIAYLILEGATYEDALNFIKSIRTFIHPTRPQVAQLKLFEKQQIHF